MSQTANINFRQGTVRLELYENHVNIYKKLLWSSLITHFCVSGFIITIAFVKGFFESNKILKMILLLIIHVISVSILISYHEYYYSPDQQRSIIYSPDFRWHQYIDEERTEWLLKDRHTELNNVNFENESRDSLDKRCLICFDEILSNSDCGYLKVKCCNKMYCIKCISKWCNRTNKCPNCKRMLLLD